MEIKCFLSSKCGTEESLRKNIAQALSLETAEAQVDFYRIDDENAVEIASSGSPSIFINGTELQPQEAVGFT